MRKQKKFHYIYKITRTDGKYYIGLHSTDNLEDGYFGSGKRLRRSIRKYGKDAHTKEIIEFLPSREELKRREAELVNEECIVDPMCMNIALGGEGGFDHLNNGSHDHIERCKKAGKKGYKKFVEKMTEKLGENWRCILQNQNEHKRVTGWKNKFENDESFRNKIIKGSKKARIAALSESSKQKRKETMAKNGHSQGEKNSQFGKMWITNGVESVKIKKDEPIPEGWRKGRVVGR